MAGHYGVFCDVCHEPVEYADLLRHECTQPDGTLPTSDWNYRLPEEDLAQPVHAETTHVRCTVCDDSIPIDTARQMVNGRWSCTLHVPIPDPQDIEFDIGRAVKRWRISR